MSLPAVQHHPFIQFVRLICLTAIGIAGGAALSLAWAAGGMLWSGIPGPPRMAHGYINDWGGIAAGGAFCGLISLNYVLPLLYNTSIRHAAPWAYGTCAAIVALLACVHPALGFLAAAPVQVTGCIIARKYYGRATGVDHSACARCGYSLVGLSERVCPECGLGAPPRLAKRR
ncbi:hypothetical protein BH11PLA1_BH11PLA1_17140 [soil metagenome]